MGNPAGVKRDFKALESRRLRAAQLLKRGLSQAEVARRVGVHRQSVSRWRKAEGRAGWKAAGRAGRKPRLSPADLQRLERGLKQGPQALGYATQLWTARRVVELIERTWGVKYHAGYVGRILRRLGWSCQRPVGRALERDEAAIRRWKKQRWPALKKKPTNRAKRSSSSTKAD